MATASHLGGLGCLATVGLLVGACAGAAAPSAPAAGSGSSSGGAGAATGADAGTRATAHDDRLELTLELDDAVTLERVPMRTVRLHVRNLTATATRIFMPRAEEFRAGASTVSFQAGAAFFTAPEPRPHGYVISEADFPVLAPGERRTFTQAFTLDPHTPGAGGAPQRRPGFAPGTPVRVRWTLRNERTRWPGGVQTLDGVTTPLFGGGDIPGLWTGELTATLAWTAPT